MRMRQEMASLVRALNEDGCGAELRLEDAEYAELQAILDAHPELWPVALADSLMLLRRRLRWESIDRRAIPEPLMAFFDGKVVRDQDPMELARQIGREIGSACEACGCRC